jgi:hypothetical protein
MGETRNAYRILVERPVGKRPFCKPRRRWEDNIKMGLGEIDYEFGRWMELAQNRAQMRMLVLAVLNIRILLAKR